jgi:hypothetical protein
MLSVSAHAELISPTVYYENMHRAVSAVGSLRFLIYPTASEKCIMLLLQSENPDNLKVDSCWHL